MKNYRANLQNIATGEMIQVMIQANSIEEAQAMIQAQYAAEWLISGPF